MCYLTAVLLVVLYALESVTRSWFSIPSYVDDLLSRGIHTDVLVLYPVGSLSFTGSVLQGAAAAHGLLLASVAQYH